MDQPERRGANYMLAGNSLNGARWGYTINLQAIQDRLVPCKKCEQQLFTKDISWNRTPCSKCSQWEMIRDDDFLAWNAPKGFPECNECKNGTLLPKKIDYSHLFHAVNVTHSHLVSGKWSKTQGCFCHITALTKKLPLLLFLVRRISEHSKTLPPKRI
jgi:hypothetical protein